ncbi:hypothetical protein [Microbispora bryophytorum]|uniref:hypothetical protein n=1 Tax=Microbispora bryophytorum TaxID=1460882 RepID=UPI0033C2C89B
MRLVRGHLAGDAGASGPARWAVRDEEGDRLLPEDFSLGEALSLVRPRPLPPIPRGGDR